jgi:hypothetical protein
MTGVRALFDNRWLHLFALDAEGRMAWRYNGGLTWVEMPGPGYVRALPAPPEIPTAKVRRHRRGWGVMGRTGGAVGRKSPACPVAMPPPCPMRRRRSRRIA